MNDQEDMWSENVRLPVLCGKHGDTHGNYPVGKPNEESARFRYRSKSCTDIVGLAFLTFLPAGSSLIKRRFLTIRELRWCPRFFRSVLSQVRGLERSVARIYQLTANVDSFSCGACGHIWTAPPHESA